MNRLDELTSGFLASALSGPDMDELVRSLEAKPGGWADFLETRRIEQLLGVLYQPTDQDTVEAVIQELRQETDACVESILHEISTTPRANTLQPRSFRERLWLWIASASPPLRWVAAGATVLALAFVIWFLNPTSGEPVIDKLEGPTISIVRQGAYSPGVRGTRLKPGDLVRTGTDTTALISFEKERTSFRLAPATELFVASVRRQKRFDLRTGGLEAVAARQAPFRPLLIKTTNAEARVIGTQFNLRLTNNATRLEVTAGSVRFVPASDGEAIRVFEGHYAIAGADYQLRALPLTGRILNQYWTNYPGEFMAVITSDPTYSEHPNGSEYLNRFETPSRSVPRFGERVRAYLHPPVTGKYRFTIAVSGPGYAELFLSRDDKPEHRTQIAEGDNEPQGTGPEPPPASVFLVAGQMYYVEALHDSKGDSSFSVRWEGPNRARETIPGEFLSPFSKQAKRGRR